MGHREERHQGLECIRRTVQFPCHGWAVGPNNDMYTVFPLVRAVEMRMSGEDGRAPMRARPASEVWSIHSSLMRLTFVLRKIARLEQVLRTNALKNRMPMEEGAVWLEAHQEMPIWIDYFFVDFRRLADQLAVTLGHLASDAPKSFPRKYKTLLDAAEKPTVHKNLRLRVDQQAFLGALQRNSDWFRLLVGPCPDSPKGIRDALMHRFAMPRLSFSGHDDNLYERLHAELEGFDPDIPRIDVLQAIRRVVTSFCRCLSALPLEIWNPQEFVFGDFLYRSVCEDLGLKRFVPCITTHHV